MVKGYLFDTTIFLDYFRGSSPQHLAAKNLFIEKQTSSEVHFSVVTMYELLIGKNATRERINKVELFLSRLTTLAVTEEVVKKAASLQRKYLREGKQIKTADSLIAETAWEHNLVLVTSNVKDFDFIEEIEVQKPY